MKTFDKDGKIKLIALIDIKKTPSVSSLWAYAGQTPDSKRTKGKTYHPNVHLNRIIRFH